MQELAHRETKNGSFSYAFKSSSRIENDFIYKLGLIQDIGKSLRKMQEMALFQRAAKIFPLLLLHFWVANLVDFAHADPPYPLCSNILNQNSSFQSNLNILLDFLPSNASVKKLYDSSNGNDPDKIYAQYMCLNYVANEDCRTCVTLATDHVRQSCTNNTEAIVWEEYCQLRYSNRRFLGQLDVSGNLGLDNKRNVSNPEHFRPVVNQTVSNLIKKAVFDESANMYATGEASIKDSDRLHALVQCTTDLSSADCNTCLQVALANLSSCCSFSRGARLLSRSCYLRYELYAFYKGETGESSASEQNLGTGKSKWFYMVNLQLLFIV